MAAQDAKILLADEKASLHRQYASALRHAGFDVLSARDAESAHATAERESLAVIVLGSCLLDAEGGKLLAGIRSLEPTALTPVIVVAFEDDLGERLHALEAGASDYLIAPVECHELVARVRSHVQRRDLWASVAGDFFRGHLDVLRDLISLEHEASPRELAAAVCERVRVNLPDVEGAALFRFVGVAGAVLLAGYGTPAEGLKVGAPVPAEAAAWLRLSAENGPAILDEESPLCRRGGRWRPAPRSVIVPVDGLNEPFGVLELALSGSSTLTRYLRLSAALDVAGVTSVLLKPTMKREAAERDIRATLSENLENLAFTTVFQPIVDLETEGTVGFEALTRFFDGVSPEVHLRDTARVGMRPALEEALARAAIAASARLPDGTWLSLNASPEFASSGPTLGRLLAQTSRPVVIELTEQEVVEDYELLKAILADLPFGTRVAVDDAGAGYASLAHVVKLDPSFIKLDRSWVTSLEADAARRALIGALAGFAESVGCVLIAEGVETAAELAALRELGVALGQGYLFGVPAPAPARSQVRRRAAQSARCG